MDILELLVWPFWACLVLTGMLCYLGIHVVGRGVIFVDLAMAQLAFLGSAAALFALGLMGSQAEFDGPPSPTTEVAANDSGAMGNEAAHVAARLDAMQDLVFDKAITDALVDGLLPPDTTADDANREGLATDASPAPIKTPRTPGFAKRSRPANRDQDALRSVSSRRSPQPGSAPPREPLFQRRHRCWP